MKESDKKKQGYIPHHVTYSATLKTTERTFIVNRLFSPHVQSVKYKC